MGSPAARAQLLLLLLLVVGTQIEGICFALLRLRLCSNRAQELRDA